MILLQSMNVQRPDENGPNPFSNLAKFNISPTGTHVYPSRSTREDRTAVNKGKTTHYQNDTRQYDM